MTSSNPIYFLIEGLSLIADMLNSHVFLNIPIFVWLIGFVVISMVVSVFWRGARG